VLVTVCAAAAALPVVALAGTYPVYVCPGQGGANNALAFSDNTSHISSSQWCNGEGSGRGVQVWSNNSVSGAQAGGWWFYAPSGTTITGLSSSGQFSAFDGWIANWATNTNGSGDPYNGPEDCPVTNCDNQSLTDASTAVGNATTIGFGIWCHASSCAGNDGQSWFGPAASANVYDATMTINDPSPPSLSSAGSLTNQPTWVSDANAGTGWQLTATASDPGGPCSVAVSIGSEQAQASNAPDYTHAQPCGASPLSTELSFNPCALPDGQYTISETSTNPTGAVGYGPSNGQVVRVDCTPPSTSVASAPAASRWYASAQQVVFTGSDNYSGVGQMHCNDGDHAGGSYTETVSAQGSTTVFCQAVDNAQNAGNIGTASVNLDYQAPTVSFSGPGQSGWVSGSEGITATGSEAQPLSGVASVSCSIDGAAATVTSGASQLVKIAADGAHTITCQATSGAGVTGPKASYTVHVDNDPPALVLSGGPPPGTWATTAQSITVSAADQLGLSGLSQIQCTLGAITNTYTTSPVQITVQPPGGTLACKAEDNAGNWSATQAWQFLIDNSVATGEFVAQSPSDPALAQVLLADSGSGVAGARIEIQTAAGWQPLRTSWDQSTGIASATVPDDGSIPDGSHLLEALAWTVAGNQATITDGPGGTPESVTLPLRIQTAIKVAAGRVLKSSCVKERQVTRRAHGHRAFRAAAARLVRICRLVTVPGAERDMLLRYGQQQTIQGQLKTLDGSPLAGATVTVTATAAGWRARTLGTVVTNKHGNFAYTVPAVASETVSFTYQGTDTLREIVKTAVIRVIGRGRLQVARPAVAGRAILFTGRVLGGFIPPGGALVQLEYRIKGVPVDFAPFGPLIHTNRQGRFAFRRPMATNAGGYTYLFKAVVEQQNGWPFLTTTTNTVARHVRG